MNEFQSLRFLDLFKRLFLFLGIDYVVMRKILQVKLTMDQRRVPTIFNGAAKKKEGNHFLKSLALYAFYGLILIPFILLGENYMFQMSLVFGMIMFILMTSMISDFSSVLLDLRDKNILYTKPLSRKTISAAKTLHVMIYMTFITVAFVAIPLVISIVSQGILFSLLFLLELILVNLFVVVLTALIYLVVLRFFNGERLKDIINYVQIILSISILVGYQLIARAFGIVNLDISYTFSWWHTLIPAFWYGAPYELLLHQKISGVMIMFSVLAVCVPLLSFFIYYRLMPSFERNLQKLLTDTGKGEKKWRGLDDFWSKITCRSKEERLFFRFSSLMMQQEREFKLKVYPALGLSIVFPLLFVFNDLRFSSLDEISQGKKYLNIYFCNLMIPSIVHMLKFSGSYKGNWIYRTAPISQISSIYSGTLKAFLVKLYFPILIIISIIYIWIFSLRIVPDLFIVFLAGIVQVLITYKILNDEEYPFSQSFEFAQETQGVKNFLLICLTGLFVVMHFFALLIPYGLYVYLLILLIGTIVSWTIVFPGNSKNALFNNNFRRLITKKII
jgi:ABC-2 type transport system permease protein